ncbi:MAG: DEAD/DEAH box helicase family protein, partial [Alphaproteobacteria bacterium]|nr:DEAD/DEAH box helicase family protein [Alphaproteobacteria bacterium]
MQTNNLFDKKEYINTDSPKYALALVNITGLGVKTFSYLIPDEMKDDIKIGQAILVPFGRQGLINAFCVGFSNYLPEGIKAKKINRILDTTPLFSIEYLKLLEWVANYYCCDLVTVLNAAIPMKLIEKNSKTESVIEFIEYGNSTKRQRAILEMLEKIGKISLTEFEKQVKTTRTTVKKLETLGCVKITDEEIYRNPLDVLNIEETEPLFELEGEQKTVYEGIKKAISDYFERKKDIKEDEVLPPLSILLHGVTASGKTEVYFKLIDDCIKSGKNVLFLAPEIALASQLTKRLARKFGTHDVAIWHSSISEGERYDVWQRL